MEDTYLHKGLRKKLVDEINKKGINDQRVLDAINQVPRHLFMDSSFIHFAYQLLLLTHKYNPKHQR